MNLEAGKKTLNVVPVFNEGLVLHDAYSKQDVTVKIGKVELDSEYDIVLLEAK
jgi:alpha-amylase